MLPGPTKVGYWAFSEDMTDGFPPPASSTAGRIVRSIMETAMGGQKIKTEKTGVYIVATLTKAWRIFIP